MIADMVNMENIMSQPNLFDQARALEEGTDLIEIPKGGTLGELPWLDLDEWHKSNPLEPIPPDPGTFSKEALSQLPNMSWLEHVSVELVYPTGKSLAEQREELRRFKVRLYAELNRLPRDTCPAKFPPGYNERVLALDTENTGLDVRVRYVNGKLVTRTLLVGLCLASSGEKGYYLPVRNTEEDGVPNWNHQAMIEFIDELHDECVIIYSNAAYDREVLTLNGCTLKRTFPYFFDDQILDFLTDVNIPRHGLKPVSEKRLGRKMVEIQELLYGIGTKKAKSTYIQFNRLPAINAATYGACVSGETEVQIELSCYRRNEYISVCDKNLPPKFIPYLPNTEQSPILTHTLPQSSPCNLPANADRKHLYDGTMFKQVIQDLIAKIAAINTDLRSIGLALNKMKGLSFSENAVLRRELDTLKVLIQQVKSLLDLSANAAKKPQGLPSMPIDQREPYNVKTVKENNDSEILPGGKSILVGIQTLILKLENLVKESGEKKNGTETGQLKSLPVIEEDASSQERLKNWKPTIFTVGRRILSLGYSILMECLSQWKSIISSIRNMESEEIHTNSLQSSFLNELGDVLSGLTSDKCVRTTVTINQLRELILTQRYSIKVASRYGFVSITAFLDRGPKQTISINGRPSCSLDQRYEIFNGACLVWRNAGSLRVGDHLSTTKGLETIERIEITGSKEVYDLSIDHYAHCYWASQVSAHNCDAINTYALFQLFATTTFNNVFKAQPIPVELDHKFIDVLRRICRPGMPINFRYFYYAAMDAIQRWKSTEEFIYVLLGRKIELGSSQQLSNLLFEELQIPLLFNHKRGDHADGSKGLPSTDEKTLDALYALHPDIIQLKFIVQWRKLNNAVVKMFNNCLVNSYVDEVLPYTKVQLAFSQTTADTGRLSSQSSDGAERLSLKVAPKTGKRTWQYHSGSWQAGFNSQGIPSAPYIMKKCKKIKSLPPESGIDLSNLYPKDTRDALYIGLAKSK